jgi:hypothetical protein
MDACVNRQDSIRPRGPARNNTDWWFGTPKFPLTFS